MTLELLHLEYLEGNPSGYRYTAFCDHYRGWLDKHRLSMRQVHLGGEKMLVDYSGRDRTSSTSRLARSSTWSSSWRCVARLRARTPKRR